MIKTQPHLLRISDHLRENEHYAEARVYFDLCIEVANNFLRSLDSAPKLKSLGPQDRPVFTALLALMKSALHNLLGVALLANEGLVQQAPILTRAIYENLITLRYLLSADSKARSEQFLASEALNKMRLLNWMRDPKTPRNFVDPEFLGQQDQIESEFNSFMDKYFPKMDKEKPPKSWHGLQLKQFFDKVTKPAAHEHAYAMFSGSVHSDFIAIRLHPELLETRGARASLATHVMPGELRSQIRMAIALFLTSWREYAETYQPESIEAVDALDNNLLEIAVSDMQVYGESRTRGRRPD